MCKNDCLDCSNLCLDDFSFTSWRCVVGHKLNRDEVEIITCQEESCIDFKLKEWD